MAHHHPVVRPAGGLLRLYPRWWRARYEDEVLDLLETRRPSRRDRLDLVRGALDAHLHPDRPSLVPAFASLSAGATWTLVALLAATQPVPLDWPGYVEEGLPLALIGAGCLAVAVGGLWLRLGDSAGRFDRLSLIVAVLAHLAWAVALLGALLRIDYGTSTAIAADVAAIGEGLLAASLVRHGQAMLGCLLAAAAASIVIPVGWSFLAFGLLWSGIGLFQWRDVGEAQRIGPGPA